MRDEDREILEEAIRNSAAGEDFDEMLLRTTKKHLPRKYHRQFTVLLEEILNEAEERCLSNRQAAQNMLKAVVAGKSVQRPQHAPAPPPMAEVLEPSEERNATPVRADATEQIIAKHLHQARPLDREEHEKQPAGTDSTIKPPEHANVGTEADAELEVEGPEGPEGPVEKLPQTEKIVDLGGTHPESLPPELRDKLKKLVKAQKKKQAWDEKAADEEVEPGLFFKGQQRAPPIVPLRKPERKDEAAAHPPGGKNKDDEEEDLEGPERPKTKVKKLRK
jgi:hypothetical protein